MLEPEPPTVDLLGLRFAAITEREAVSRIIRSVQDGVGGWLITPNTHQMGLIAKDADLRDFVRGATLTVADGMPLVWAATLRGDPLPERVAGSSLVWSLARAAGVAGRSLFLLGGDDGVADRAAARLRSDIPGLEVVGTHCPPRGFETNLQEGEVIRARLRSTKPDIVYVGLGFPKQENLIAELRAEFEHVWFLGIGISLSFISGDAARAPRWLQRVGLEWVHRLVQDPRRLFGRYIVRGVPFTFGLLARSWWHGLSARRNRVVDHDDPVQ
jgi:N-acetylglucosaminyldiphosphoundecaprenol N-acetyl-beta-D-mannosaminyltransferase